MFKNIQNKKGFTLTELAIVLVVIGLMLGMTFKGKSLVDAARIKSDIQKVNKIAAAVNVFYSQYNVLPGTTKDNAGVITVPPVAFYDDLIKEGLLQEKDMRISMLDGGNALLVVGCQDALEGTNQVWRAVVASNQNSLCLFVRGDVASLAGIKGMTAADAVHYVTLNYMRDISICQMETLLDDKNLFSGDGRVAVVGQRLNMDDMINKMTSSNFDCSKWQQGANAVASGATYMFKIF